MGLLDTPSLAFSAECGVDVPVITPSGDGKSSLNYQRRKPIKSSHHSSLWHCINKHLNILSPTRQLDAMARNTGNRPAVQAGSVRPPTGNPATTD